MKARMILCALAATMMIFASCEREDNPSGGGGNDDQQQGAFDENGATRSSFSIGEGRQIHFSRGNLQYQASTGTWRFAEHQWDVVGEANANASSTYDGWIDIFGWGTSGWNSGAICYHPWDGETENMEEDCRRYWPGNDSTADLTGAYANADWGVYNAISNGGNRPNMWRTLTLEEWAYLVGNEGPREGKCGYGLIDNTHRGVILLPDNWVMPEGLSFSPCNYEWNQDLPSDSTCYTLEEWAKMEEAGALFLPAGGTRRFGGYQYCNDFGFYWSSTAEHIGYIEQFAGCFLFGWIPMATPPCATATWRQYGMCVRLVRAE